MAEFGTFAAALQIAETVWKLKKLWSDIRHASADLNELAEEVILHAELLGSLRQQPLTRTVPTDDESWRKCHRLFERCVASLQALVDDLSLVRQTHVKTGSVRVYLRRDDLKKCRERLQRAQTIIVLAQQAYSIAISTSYGTLILEELGRLQQPQSKSITNAKSKTKRCRPSKKSCSTTNKTRPFIGGNRRSSRADHRSAVSLNENTKSLISFRFPTWTVWKCVHVWMHRSNRSFGINFRIYNTRPNDSDLFKLSRSGNWTEVRQMLTNRAASPFDVDEWGTTLLHIAASQARPDVCRLLISQGLDASCRTWQDNRTPLETLALAFRHVHEVEPRSDASLDTTQLLLASARQARVDYSTEPKHWLYRCSLPSSVLSVLIAAVIPNYNTVGPVVRARLAMSTTASDPESITVLLGHDLTLQQAFELTSTKPVRGYGHRQLLFNASRCLAKLGPNTKRRAGWLSIMKSIISFESRNQSILSTTTFPFRSLYVHYIAFHMAASSSSSSLSLQTPQKSPSSPSSPSSPWHGKDTTWNTHLTSIGKIWLDILKTCGASLSRYGKAEKSTLKHTETIIWRSKNQTRSTCFRVKFLNMSSSSTGDDVDGWKIYVVPAVHTYRRAGSSSKNSGSKFTSATAVVVSEGHMEYEMAGAFWNFVENPEIFGVPGAFLGGGGDGSEDVGVEMNVGRPVNFKGSIF